MTSPCTARHKCFLIALGLSLLALSGVSATARAALGDTLECFVEGDIYLSGQWQRLAPTRIEIGRGDRRKIPLVTFDRRLISDGVVAFDGYRVSLCDRHYGLTRAPDQCASISAAPRQYLHGISGRVTTSRFLRGRMYCGFPLYSDPQARDQ